MSENRVQFNAIVSNQLPLYVREDFPLISEFLKQYYLGQEYQGGPIDLIQNIDKYIKLDETTNLSESVVLNGDLDFDETTIKVDPGESPTGTTGFPDSYGLLQINDEIITYTGKTNFSFTGCIRGFVGITSYRSELNKEEVIFKKNPMIIRWINVKNKVVYFKGIFIKNKTSIFEFEDRSFASELNQNIFIKQAKDFYLSKGTDVSFEILFKALYNEDVKVIKPRDFLVAPSDAQYRITNDLVVEAIDGDPENLENATLYQDQYKFGNGINKAYAQLQTLKKYMSDMDKLYEGGFDGGYNRDNGVDGSLYGQFM